MLTTKSKAVKITSNTLDTFATFASTVVSRLPRDLGVETMRSWYDNPHDLKRALAEALAASAYRPSWLARRELFAVVLGTNEDLYNVKLNEERDGWSVRRDDEPGCEHGSGIRPGIVEVLTLATEIPRQELNQYLLPLSLRPANEEEIDAFGKYHRDHLLAGNDHGCSLTAPGTKIQVKWRYSGFPILMVQKKSYPSQEMEVVSGMRQDNQFEKWDKGEMLLAARQS